VVAAAVILDPGARLVGIDDSKRLAADERVQLSDAIVAQARAVAVASIAPSEIDRLNIRRATFQAMRTAILDLGIPPRLVLVDGEAAIPQLPWNQEAVVGGDGKSLAIACASVVAKVWRDRLMADLDRRYPGYGFARHKGYATSEHLEALARLGPCPIHRRSFAPVRLAAQLMLW
jgi:ribonuclease HII